MQLYARLCRHVQWWLAVSVFPYLLLENSRSEYSYLASRQRAPAPWPFQHRCDKKWSAPSKYRTVNLAMALWTPKRTPEKGSDMAKCFENTGFSLPLSAAAIRKSPPPPPLLSTPFPPRPRRPQQQKYRRHGPVGNRTVKLTEQVEI